MNNKINHKLVFIPSLELSWGKPHSGPTFTPTTYIGQSIPAIRGSQLTGTPQEGKYDNGAIYFAPYSRDSLKNLIRGFYRDFLGWNIIDQPDMTPEHRREIASHINEIMLYATNMGFKEYVYAKTYLHSTKAFGQYAQFMKLNFHISPYLYYKMQLSMVWSYLQKRYPNALKQFNYNL